MKKQLVVRIIWLVITLALLLIAVIKPLPTGLIVTMSVCFVLAISLLVSSFPRKKQ